MKPFSNIQGWQIQHHEKLLFQANAGTPIIRLKFYHYPSYRQTVEINKPPEQCKLKNKGENTYFIFHHKVGAKGIISIERTISVYPKSFTPNNADWGKISDFSSHLQRKYQQRLRYWPQHAQVIQDISNQDWFNIDDLFAWVQSANTYIKEKIKYPEKQEKRLGAEQAFLTGSGDCDEFTDLFITIARMRGIPCRRLTGFFIQQNLTSEAHAWGEIQTPEKVWIPIDIALHNIGHHTMNYIVLKIEEFNPALPDYQIQTKHSTTVHHQWELPTPLFTPIY